MIAAWEASITAPVNDISILRSARHVQSRALLKLRELSRGPCVESLNLAIS